ncbi:rhomboid family intramembrane serine protease [Candidatus Binatus sp.]|jgi:membrane associated rhomboid family serine protease|uniref:rhomboid family intramembrane serine protease n=1 Tax=Candidatus Binatus sp. TaxID=2811406 RepID=UPI003CAD013D
MIPLRDNVAPRRLTPINSALIAANVAVFVYELSLGTRVAAFVERFALVPAAVTRALTSGAHRNVEALAPLMTTVTSMFVHGGFWHIAGNMLYLFIFGAAVEYRLGALRYLIFYFAAGIAAALATVWIAPESSVPVIGASGAIAGVLGAYFILYPRGRILTILPIFIFIQFVEIPAVIYLLFWFAVQLYAGLEQSGGAAAMGGVAWWAHVGGFMFGIALGPMLAVNRPRRRRSR